MGRGGGGQNMAHHELKRTFNLTVSHKIKFTIIVEDFPVEVYVGVVEHKSLLDYSVQVWEIRENQQEALGSGYF